MGAFVDGRDQVEGATRRLVAALTFVPLADDTSEFLYGADDVDHEVARVLRASLSCVAVWPIDHASGASFAGSSSRGVASGVLGRATACNTLDRLENGARWPHPVAPRFFEVC